MGEYNLIDSHNGKRYRIENGIKVYEPELYMNGLSVPESQVEHMKRKLEENQKRFDEKDKLLHIKASGTCPFKLKEMKKGCTENCVLFAEGMCQLSLIGDSEKHIETEGKICPISTRECRTDCNMNVNGCVLAKIKVKEK